jgi:putative hydrolase of the HAD superfamily
MVEAVLLDVGGIFHLPDPTRIAGALARSGFDVDARRLARAHYGGATAFHIDYEGDLPWNEMWAGYIDAYAREAQVPEDLLAEAVEHLKAEFTTDALWSHVVPGSKEGLEALVDTGVIVGVVSNADGTVASRLREREILQVGPGPGVTVATVIDSGTVGVSKPDPAIFAIALDAIGTSPQTTWYVGDMPGIDVVGARAAGLHPLVMDPFGLHRGVEFDRVESLLEVAALVTAARG